MLEIAVVIGEGLLIRLMMRYPYAKSLLMSLLFNACSFGAGLLLRIM